MGTGAAGTTGISGEDGIVSASLIGIDLSGATDVWLGNTEIVAAMIGTGGDGGDALGPDGSSATDEEGGDGGDGAAATGGNASDVPFEGGDGGDATGGDGNPGGFATGGAGGDATGPTLAGGSASGTAGGMGGSGTAVDGSGGLGGIGSRGGGGIVSGYVTGVISAALPMSQSGPPM